MLPLSCLYALYELWASGEDVLDFLIAHDGCQPIKKLCDWGTLMFLPD